MYDNKKATTFYVVALSSVAGAGIEPATSWLWIMRSNQLSYPAITCFAAAKVIQSFEITKFFFIFIPFSDKFRNFVPWTSKKIQIITHYLYGE